MIALARLRFHAAIAPPRSMRLALDVGLVFALFYGTHAAYRASTGHIQNCDSTYSLVVGEMLLTEGAVNMQGCVPADAPLPYQLIRRTDPRRPAEPPAIYYGYPLGSTILSLPFVQVSCLDRGLSMLHPDGRPHAAIEDLLQLRIASRVSAAIVAMFYILCRFYCPPGVSLLIAAGFAFGSPVWSTLSRSLWSHTWMVACLTAAIAVLVARRHWSRSWRTDLLFGLALGTTSFWVLFVRAHGLFSIAAIGVYLLIHYCRTLLVTVSVGALWSAGLVALSLYAFGTPTPPSGYDLAAIDGRDVANRFAWLMVSPSRGLLVFCPYVAAVAFTLIGFRKHLTDAGLLLPAGLAMAGHALLLSCYDGWHMGSSYGPRYFCDLLPWFVLATAIAAQALAAVPGISWCKVGAIAALAVGFGWGVFVHARGANSMKAWLWNERAIAVGQERAVKEWRHPQFLAGIGFEVTSDGSVREK